MRKLTIIEETEVIRAMHMLYEVKPHATLKDYKEVTGRSTATIYKLAEKHGIALGSYNRRNSGVVSVVTFREQPQVVVTASYLREAGLDAKKEVKVTVKGGRVILEKLNG